MITIRVTRAEYEAWSGYRPDPTTIGVSITNKERTEVVQEYIFLDDKQEIEELKYLASLGSTNPEQHPRSNA